MKMIRPLAVTVALISAANFAQALAPAKMDANKDGAVTQEEFMAFYAPIDRGYDKNGDGFVSIQEWPGRHRHHLAPNDADKDGRLSLEEITNMRMRHFKEMDKNGNGILESEI
jgi:Ca2+-binding EF-hand superfamily protein